jgi:hypothetical protein
MDTEAEHDGRTKTSGAIAGRPMETLYLFRGIRHWLYICRWRIGSSVETENSVR